MNDSDIVTTRDPRRLRAVRDPGRWANRGIPGVQHAPSSSLDEAIGEAPSRDARIAGLYERLASLAALLPTNPELRPEYDGQFAALRRLQEDEARAMREALRRERALDPAALARALAKADALLDAHGRPSRTDDDP
jgi:hypothetical protein